MRYHFIHTVVSHPIISRYDSRIYKVSGSLAAQVYRVLVLAFILSMSIAQ